MAEERILPPFPDELVTAGVKEDAIRFLLELALPSQIAVNHLVRWGEVAGVPINADDRERVRKTSGRGA